MTMPPWSLDLIALQDAIVLATFVIGASYPSHLLETDFDAKAPRKRKTPVPEALGVSAIVRGHWDDGAIFHPREVVVTTNIVWPNFCESANTSGGWGVLENFTFTRF